jgi:autotransporter strand-loop-strand O-heptosyltransferase
MKEPKVYGHGAYIGTTGYANHTRDFFRHLSKHLQLKVRNYPVGKTWEGNKDEPHNKEPYLNPLDKKLLIEQTLQTGDNKREDFPIYTKHGDKFDHNLNLILMETNHYYFYDYYKGPKIGYNVWETTLQPQSFFDKWKTYDQVWVPSKWQAECTIAQGMPSDKVKVVPEGVDVNTFYPEDPQTTLDYVDGRFKFILFGRWEYRKATKEIIETFLKTFTKEDPVDLILSADNNFATDGLKSTEERLKHFGFVDERIKVKHFPSRKDYITYIKNGHVFLSCARSEGWNLPLIEAMACGTPSIYSNCSGQTEFASGKGLPVKIIGEKPNPDNVGNYYEPNFEDLSLVMRDAFENYTDHKKRALEEAKIIHRDFNWEKVAEIGKQTIDNFLENYKEPEDSNTINVTYIGKPKVEILGDVSKEYKVEFINKDTNEVLHSSVINNNMWTQCSIEYYIPWLIKVNGKEVSHLELENQRVLISLSSNSIGDTIGWAPYAVEFAKKYKCKVVLSTFHNDWFQNVEAYKDIEWLSPGNSTGCVAHYKIGWHRDENGGWNNIEMHPRQCNTIRMQETATDILNLDFKELNYGLAFPKGKRPIKDKYIVIGPNATSGCKEWVYGNWVILTKLLNQLGYKVICLTQNEFKIQGAINHYGQPLSVVANYLHHADLFIGLGSGLSWLNWALNKHTIMINGFSEKNHEFTSRVTRIMNDDVCFPCWTNPNFKFDAGDWDWCPIWKGTDKQHICQKSITPTQVFKTIKNRLKK